MEIIISSESRQDMISLEEVEPRVAGMPHAATTTPNSTDLRKKHIRMTIDQKRVFRDQIVDAETGRPVLRFRQFRARAD